MQYSHLLLFAIAANAQSSSSGASILSSSASSSGGDVTLITGTSEMATPTGSYISYASTLTVSSSALSTVPVISLITTGESVRTSTIGSTTIFGYNTLVAGNSSGTASTTNSQFILTGRPTTTAGNSTSNSTATSTASTVQPTNTTPCNNYAEFCSRRYGNITEVAAHNSPFYVTGNAASNQALDVTTQLNDGIRLLQGQVHFQNSTPHFCHSSCDILDAGPITTYLTTVREWVDKHPYDVVTILIGNGGYDAVELFVPFIEETGLVEYAYLPPKIPMGIDDWPTLASMILTGKRVVFFMDYEANQGSVPWMLDEFSQMWETPFDPTNRSFPCTVQRPPDLAIEQVQNRLYMVNHNLNYDLQLLGNSILVPNTPLLNQTNNVTGFGSLGLNAEQCTDTYEYAPKFLNVDYYNVGNGSVFEVAAQMNNVTYTRECCGQTTTNASLGMNEVIGRSAMLLALCVVGASLMLL